MLMTFSLKCTQKIFKNSHCILYSETFLGKLIYVKKINNINTTVCLGTTLSFSLNIRNHVSEPLESQGKIMVLYSFFSLYVFTALEKTEDS
jgi:hypothetical protein